MDEAVFEFAVGKRQREELFGLEIAGRRRREAGGVVFEDLLHLLAALLPLFGGGHLLAAFQGQHVGQFGVIGEFVDAGHFGKGGFYLREGISLGSGPATGDPGAALGQEEGGGSCAGQDCQSVNNDAVCHVRTPG